MQGYTASMASGWRDHDIPISLIRDRFKKVPTPPTVLGYQLHYPGQPEPEQNVVEGMGGSALFDELQWVLRALAAGQVSRADVFFVTSQAVRATAVQRIPGTNTFGGPRSTALPVSVFPAGESGGIFEAVRSFVDAVADTLHPVPKPDGITAACEWAVLSFVKQ